MTAWTSAERRVKRAEYDRHYRTGHAADQAGRRMSVPADVVVLESDPSPCFWCGDREGCKHRSIFGW